MEMLISGCHSYDWQVQIKISFLQMVLIIITRVKKTPPGQLLSLLWSGPYSYLISETGANQWYKKYMEYQVRKGKLLNIDSLLQEAKKFTKTIAS